MDVCIIITLMMLLSCAVKKFSVHDMATGYFVVNKGGFVSKNICLDQGSKKFQFLPFLY